MMKIYRCEKCGNIIVKLTDAGVPVVCCGEPMKEMTANTVDAAVEKHVPAVTKENGRLKVSVGTVTHPMTEEHYIEWIMLVQGEDIQIKKLTPNEAPEADFAVRSDAPIEVYEHCTLHGLWLTEVK